MPQKIRVKVGWKGHAWEVNVFYVSGRQTFGQGPVSFCE